MINKRNVVSSTICNNIICSYIQVYYNTSYNHDYIEMQC